MKIKKLKKAIKLLGNVQVEFRRFMGSFDCEKSRAWKIRQLRNDACILDNIAQHWDDALELLEEDLDKTK